MKNKYELWLIESLDKIEHFHYEEVRNLHKYPLSVSKQVLKVLIKNSCLGQNYAPIELGRKKINEIDKEWLKQYFLEVAINCIDFSDDWEYRRLMELIVCVIPELKEEALALVENSADEDIQEVVQDYREL